MTPDFHRRLDATTQPVTGSPPRADRPIGDGRVDGLPPGSRLHEFEVLDVIGAGGFGIVYLARDHILLRQVAVKEYLPVDLARREPGGTVMPRTAAEGSTFAMGLRSFLREAQLLAGFDHPALVKVHRFWEANGTAYMAMPYYAGATLKETRRQAGCAPDERWLRAVLDPLLAALEVLHASQVCHRDVSPDNVILSPQGRPVLLDFGSARQVVGDRTQALTAVFKPSFAAIEQYGDVPGLRQGPWTDLYALAGVVHFMILGAAPVPAAMRAVHDPQRPLGAAAAGLGYSAEFLQAIDWALSVRPEQRPPSVEAFRAVLDGRTDPPHVAALRRRDASSLTATGGDPATRAVEAGHHPRLSRRALAMTVAAVTVAAGAGAVLALGGIGHDADARMSSPGTSAAASSRAALAAPPEATASPSGESRLPPVAPDAHGTASTASASATTSTASGVAPASARSRERVVAHASRQAASASRPAASSAANVAAASPAAACGDRLFLARAACMERLCREPAYRQHAECTPVRTYAESRRRAE